MPDALVSGHVEQTRHDLEGRDEEPSVQPSHSLRPNDLPASVPGSAVPAIKARKQNEHIYLISKYLGCDGRGLICDLLVALVLNLQPGPD